MYSYTKITPFALLSVVSKRHIIIPRFCTSLHFAPCTLHLALCTLHFALCTLHFGNIRLWLSPVTTTRFETIYNKKLTIYLPSYRCDSLLVQDTTMSTKTRKPPSSIRNNSKWEPMKEDIRKIYLTEHKTLLETRSEIKDIYNFTAS
jgi:hypothetical protein